MKILVELDSRVAKWLEKVYQESIEEVIKNAILDYVEGSIDYVLDDGPYTPAVNRKLAKRGEKYSLMGGKFVKCRKLVSR